MPSTVVYRLPYIDVSMLTLNDILKKKKKMHSIGNTRLLHQGGIYYVSLTSFSLGADGGSGRCPPQFDVINN